MAFGAEHKTCPFFLSRESQTNADVLLVPYNYLVDAKSRVAQNIAVSGSIIIFDEAHNLEKSCEEAASFELTGLRLGQCHAETQKACL